MNESEYYKLLSNVKSQEELDELNKQFTSSIHSSVKYQKFKSFLYSHLFDILNAIIALLALVVAILSLVLQLKEQ